MSKMFIKSALSLCAFSMLLIGCNGGTATPPSLTIATPASTMLGIAGGTMVPGAASFPCSLTQLYLVTGGVYSGPGICGQGQPPNSNAGSCTFNNMTVWCMPNPTSSAMPSTEPTTSQTDPPSVSSPTGTDLVIANNTGYPNSAVYVYAIGGGQYLQGNGTLAPMGTTPIPALPLATTGESVFPLPYMNSARIWISLNAPLQMSQGVQPGFGAETTQMFDWVELNYGGGIIYINTTQVDMFGLPITITVKDATQSQMVGLPDGSRTALIAAFQADPILKNLIIGGAAMPLRILAPDHGIDSGLIPSTYIDAYVDQVYAYYQSHPLTLTGSTETLPGTKPTGTQVFGCGDGLGPVLCSGLNRGTLIDGAPQPDYNPADFYKTTPTNGYAKIIHSLSINGKAYAFPYDDAGGGSSLLVSTHPTTVLITLSKF